MMLLSFEGAPVGASIHRRDIIAGIMLHGDDEMDCLQVWDVPFLGSRAKAEDITIPFAIQWSKQFDFRDSQSANEAIAGFPAFVQEHANAHLMAEWTKARAAARGAA